MIETIHRLLPACRSKITDISTLTADNVLSSLEEQGVGFVVKRLGCGDWDVKSSSISDDDILPLLKMAEAGHVGPLLICTEACSRYGFPPFTCDAKSLTSFVSDYDIEMFFDGDVVIVAELSRTLTVYHHAGGFVHVRL
jgi:hypothetical protein